jgi:hypothetical protein
MKRLVIVAALWLGTNLALADGYEHQPPRPPVPPTYEEPPPPPPDYYEERRERRRHQFHRVIQDMHRILDLIEDIAH